MFSHIETLLGPHVEGVYVSKRSRKGKMIPSISVFPRCSAWDIIFHNRKAEKWQPSETPSCGQCPPRCPKAKKRKPSTTRPDEAHSKK